MRRLLYIEDNEDNLYMLQLWFDVLAEDDPVAQVVPHLTFTARVQSVSIPGQPCAFSGNDEGC